MAEQKQPGAINSSTRHVFGAMREIARSDAPLGLNQIAEVLELPPSTAHRALMTLEESGFAGRVRHSARFVPGASLHHLIRSMVAQFPIRAAAAGKLSGLSRELDVTTSLNWRLGWSSIRLASFEGHQESFQLRRVGELRPLHDGIGPSAILLALPEDERNRYLSMCASGQAKIASPVNEGRTETYSRQMAAQGYLELQPSDKLGFYWISVPVRRFDGSVCGSISVGYSMHQRTGADLTADVERSREVLSELQDQLKADASSTRTHFDDLAPEDFGMMSSPSRAPISI